MGGTGRKKRQKKSMTFYRVAFGLTPPYPVVVHPEFVRQCVKSRVNLKEQLPKVMQDKTYPVTTRCIVESLKRSGDTGCAVLARQFQRVACMHTKVQQLGAGKDSRRKSVNGQGDGGEEGDDDDREEEEEEQQERRKDKRARDTPVVRPGTCIRSLLESKIGKGMAVAVAGDTSESLRRKELPQVPFLFFVPPTSVMLLPPCTDAQMKTHKRDQQKREVGKKEKQMIKKLERDTTLPPKVLGKRKRTKEPNPLSRRKPKEDKLNEKAVTPPPQKKKKKNRRRTKKAAASSGADE